MRSFPTAGVGALAQLLGALLWASLRRRDRITVLDRWVRRHSDGQDGLIVSLVVTKLLLVTGPGLSAQVLAEPPRADRFATGSLKKTGMAFLAPHALTISDGEEWVERRAFNASVLCTGRAHDLSDTMLRHVHDAFAVPLASTDEVHDRMAEVMRKVVVGGSAPRGVADDVDTLIGVVQSPLKRKALGWWYSRRRRHLYAVLDRGWGDAPEDTLVGRARGLGSASAERTEQIPHWMFTFTGSATALLSRTLAMVAARPAVQASIAAEVSAAGDLADARTVHALDYTEACLRETGRLFPPVTKTFHVAPEGGEFDGREIPAGMEILHFFPLQSRAAGDPTADEFRPDRWLGDHPPESNLFLSGARRCPGENLILFVCKAALAQVSGTLTADAPALAYDPLPRSFPAETVRLRP